MVQLFYDEIMPANSSRPGVRLPALDAGGKEWHVAAYKTPENSWDAALATALSLAEVAGGRVIFPPWETVDLHPFTVPDGVELYGDGARIRRAATYDTSVRHWITLSDDASVDGVISFDGNSGSVNHTGNQSCLRLLGDRGYVGPWIRIWGFETGTCYAIDVYGDDCEVNGVVEGSSYASCRLFATNAPLTRFTLGHFTSIDAAYKGFVFNGTEGLEVLQVGTYIARTSTTNDASESFLIDSDPDNSQIFVDTLIADTLDLQGGQSNSTKIENVGLAIIKTMRLRNAAATYASHAGARITAHNADIGTIDTDDRIILRGAARIGSLRFFGTGLQHAVEVDATYGSRINVGLLDMREGSTANVAVRVDTDGREVYMHVDRYLPSVSNPQALQSVFGTEPSNFSGYFSAGPEVALNDSGPTSAIRSRVVRPPRQFTGTEAPTSGSWQRRDIMWNSAPTAGGTLGWICVTAGTPGTWRAFGSIAT